MSHAVLRRTLLAGALAVTLAAPDAAGSDAASAPEARAQAVVESLHDALLGAMREAETLGYEGREARLDPAVREAYDLGFMARKSVGRHWRRLSEEDQRRLLDTFAQLTVANYAGRFDGFSGQRFETLGAEPGVYDTLLVKTRLVLPDEDPVQLHYRLHETSEGWKIIDVYMNGTISELALRRSEYSTILEREGFASLMEALDGKIEGLRQG